MSRQSEILEALYEHVLDGEAPPTVALTNEGLELGMDPMTLLFDDVAPVVGNIIEMGADILNPIQTSAWAWTPMS